VADYRADKQVRVLDRIDKLILKGLQGNGRKAISQLAGEVCLSSSPCYDRVRWLETHRYILRYTAILNPNLLGAAMVAFAEVTVDQSDPEALMRFRTAVNSLEEVSECHMLAGRFDYLLKIRASDVNAYRVFLADQLSKLPGVERIQTSVAMEEIKATPEVKL
jgi:Lrp/AsnC family leucine-responsive transcriptional regulator